MMMDLLFFFHVWAHRPDVIKLRYGCLDMVGLLGHEIGLPPDDCSSYTTHVYSQHFTETSAREPRYVFRVEDT
jgi:hypothetical protein